MNEERKKANTNCFTTLRAGERMSPQLAALAVLADRFPAPTSGSFAPAIPASWDQTHSPGLWGHCGHMHTAMGSLYTQSNKTIWTFNTPNSIPITFCGCVCFGFACLLVWDRVLLWGPDCSGTHYVDQAGLSLTGICWPCPEHWD